MAFPYPYDVRPPNLNPIIHNISFYIEIAIDTKTAQALENNEEEDQV
jgi:hypothetical protein